MNRHRQCDTRLTAEAQNAIAAHSGTGVNVIRRRLKMLLALETTLCTEYRYVCPLTAVVISRFTDCRRNSYFAVINLIGTPVFWFVWDNHRQCDGVIEAEEVNVSNMIESIQDVAK